MSCNHSHHDHSHHHHHHHGEISSGRLLFTVALNIVITVAEVIGGLVSGSLSLLSDALHNFSDAGASLISYITLKLSKKENTAQKTFGYKRAEILAALFNSAVLLISTFFIFREAYYRFLEPQEVKLSLMAIVAAIGLIANLIAVLLLHKDSNHNINIRSAYLHLLGDTLSSVAVIIGAVVMYFYKAAWLDPLLSVLIGFLLLRGGYSILKESIHILMAFVPTELDIEEIKTTLEDVESISNIHHIHIWRLTDQKILFEGHAELNQDVLVSKAEGIREKLEEILKQKFKIHHINLQLEFNCSHDKSLINLD